MSNSWRPNGRANRQNNQDRSGTNTPTRDAGRQQAMAALSGNAWGPGKNKGAGAGGDRQAAPAEQHVPVKDFNASEVKDFLKKRYLESIGGMQFFTSASLPDTGADDTSQADQAAVYHKVQGDSVPKRSSGVWGRGKFDRTMDELYSNNPRAGSMPHLLPSGQDFFTQLKKQLQTIEQGKTA
ncbi:hypothetical protein BDV96DRAFT_651201 [Lophiotrema nucula]|uniref:Uncharacterized protein n=1 Tax=Lophiotrema nucula TaxID=690887 RepID=A0A6A5YST4_9PLEO|nr:hypothetical protein BDV96DRAFT_651201 [Lophiotrema nucula]